MRSNKEFRHESPSLQGNDWPQSLRGDFQMGLRTFARLAFSVNFFYLTRRKLGVESTVLGHCSSDCR